MKKTLRTVIPILFVMTVAGCSNVKEVQADFMDAELVKIDTVFRYPKEEMVLTFKCQNRMQFVSYVPLQRRYQVGSIYKVLLPR